MLKKLMCIGFLALVGLSVVGCPATTLDSLSATRNYYDADDDPEADFEIKWYKNGEHQLDLDNVLEVDPELTTKHEFWHFSVRVNDGTDWSDWFDSEDTEILNSPPVVNDVSISPYPPQNVTKIDQSGAPEAGDELWAYYVYSDDDGDMQADAQLRWYKNDVVMYEYDNMDHVPGSATADGGTWYVEVSVYDGEEWSSWSFGGPVALDDFEPIADAGTDQTITASAEADPILEEDPFTLYALTYNAPLFKGGMPFVYLVSLDESMVPVTIPSLRTIANFGLGLATHPTTGELWALLGIAPAFDGQQKEAAFQLGETTLLLATVDPVSGAATPRGLVEEDIVDIAFDGDGNLYGVSRDDSDFWYFPVFGETSPVSPHSLYRIDMDSLACEFLMDLGAASDDEGEAIGFNSSQDYLCHMSGYLNMGKDLPPVVFEAVDPDELTQTPLQTSPFFEIFGGPTALSYSAYLDEYIMAARNGMIYIIGTEGQPMGKAVSEGGDDVWSVVFGFWPETDVIEGLSLGVTKMPAVPVVQLDGSASYDPEGDPLTYSWSFVSMPDGSMAELSEPSAVNPTFTPDVFGDYVLELVVNDGTSDSVPDTVTITFGNSAPVADAGPDQIVVTSQEFFMDKIPCQFTNSNAVWLNGTNSSDADCHSLSYEWSVLSVPEGSLFDISQLVTVTNQPNAYASPLALFWADAFGEYVFELTVSDGESTSTDQVTITVAPDIETTCATMTEWGASTIMKMGPTMDEIFACAIPPYALELPTSELVHAINCGGFAHGIWSDDQYWLNSDYTVWRRMNSWFGTEIFNSQRVWFQPPFQLEGEIGYSLPVDPGLYYLQMFFGEMVFMEVDDYGKRVFDVSVEGEVILPAFDTYGGQYFSIFSPTTTLVVEDNSLDIRFTRIVNDPFISAIKVDKYNTEPVIEEVLPFAVSPFEVTNAQFAAVLNYALALGVLESEPETKSVFTRYQGGDVYVNGKLLLDITEGSSIQFDGAAFFVAPAHTTDEEPVDMSNYPVTNVTWYGAIAFCNWYSQMRNLIPLYDLDLWRLTDDYRNGWIEGPEGYRLPFEPEWELAAAWEPQGQAKFIPGTHWTFGTMSNFLDSTLANYNENNPMSLNSVPYVTPVGYYNGANPGTWEAISPSYCYDMSGNVAEWVYGRANAYPDYDPYGWDEVEKDGLLEERVVRGGSWNDDEYSQRTAYRSAQLPEVADNKTGFRVVKNSWECEGFGK